MLGPYLKSLRKGRSLSFKEVTKLMEISEKNLSYIEKNTGAYSEKKLAKHVEALNFRLEMRFIDKDDARNVFVYEVKTENKTPKDGQ